MAMWVIGSRRLEGGALRNNALRNIAPQGNEQLAGQGHNSDTPDPSLRGADPIAEPAAQGRVRRMTQPKPGDFDHDALQAGIAGLGDALVAVGPAALPRARRQSGGSGHLAPVGEAAAQPLEPDKRGELAPPPL